jgi:hypothetical protein
VKGQDTTRCYTFKQEDIPASCVLSGKGRVSERVKKEVNVKYGAVGFGELEVKDQLASVALENQRRGSVNNPGDLKDVEDEEVRTNAQSSLSLLLYSNSSLRSSRSTWRRQHPRSFLCSRSSSWSAWPPAASSTS